MKDFVSSRQFSIVAAISSVLILWAVIAVPGRPAWFGVVSMGVLAVLLAAGARLLVGAPSRASMSDVIRGVEGEVAAGDPVPVTSRTPAAR